ncbi:MAG: hypothetical protein MI755_10550 [Sphingomonadales bacterium]|nr:hypothetical protein [Sphingomonadales bacterium]
MALNMRLMTRYVGLGAVAMGAVFAMTLSDRLPQSDPAPGRVGALAALDHNKLALQSSDSGSALVSRDSGTSGAIKLNSSAYLTDVLHDHVKTLENWQLPAKSDAISLFDIEADKICVYPPQAGPQNGKFDQLAGRLIALESGQPVLERTVWYVVVFPVNRPAIAVPHRRGIYPKEAACAQFATAAFTFERNTGQVTALDPILVSLSDG